MGSTFGVDTFKQRLLEFIIDESEAAGYDLITGIQETMEVVSHLSLTAFHRDKALAKMYAKAKLDAQNELIAKIRKEC